MPTKSRPSAFLSLPQPRPDLVKMVDTLFEQRRSGDYELESLKKYWKNPEDLSYLEDHKKARELAVLIVNTGVPYQACRVLLLAHSFGCTFKQSVYESVAYQMAQTGQWAELPSLVALGRSQTGRTTARLLNWRARSLVELSHFGLLDRILEQFEEEGIQPDRRTFHVLVSGHLRNRDLTRVKECLGWMEDAGFPMDASTHALLVSNYRSLGPDSAIQQKALGSLKELGERNATAVVNSLIQLSLDSRDIQSALKYLSFFDNPFPGTTDTPSGSAPSPPPADRVQARANHCANHERRDGPKPYPVLSPDIATFTMLINYAARMHDVPLALQMVERLKHFAVVPDDIFVAALVRFYIAVDDITTAISITAAACRSTPSALLYLRTLGAEKSDIGPSDLVPVDIGLSARIVNALLPGVLIHNGLDGLRTILCMLHAAGLEPDSATAEILMSHVASLRPTRPQELMRALRILPDSLKPTLRHVHILLRTIVSQQSAANSPPGWRTISHMSIPTDEDAPSPSTPEHLQSFPESPNLLGQVAESVVRHNPSYRSLVRRLVQSLASRQVSVDRATMHLAIRHEAMVNRNVGEARRTLRVMLNHGMHPNEYHYAAVIEGYARSGHLHEAEKVLWRARKAGFARDPVLFTTVIHGYGRVRQPEEASRIFRAMVQEGITPDVGAVDALAGAYFAVRAFNTAKRILVEAWERLAPFPPELHAANLKTIADSFRRLNRSQIIRLGSHQRRAFRFKLKRIVQNDQRRQATMRNKRTRKMTRKKGQRDSRDVLHRTSDNKHTIIQ